MGFLIRGVLLSDLGEPLTFEWDSEDELLFKLVCCVGE